MASSGADVPGLARLFDNVKDMSGAPEFFTFVVGPDKVNFPVNKKLLEGIPFFKKCFESKTESISLANTSPDEISLLLHYLYRGALAMQKPVTAEIEIRRQQYLFVRLLMMAEIFGIDDLFNRVMVRYQALLKATDRDIMPEHLEMISNHQARIPVCKAFASHYSAYLFTKNRPGAPIANPRDDENQTYRMLSSKQHKKQPWTTNPANANPMWLKTSGNSSALVRTSVVGSDQNVIRCPGTVNPGYRDDQCPISDPQVPFETKSKYLSISMQPSFEDFSHEELRLADYMAGHRYGLSNKGFAHGGLRSSAQSAFQSQLGSSLPSSYSSGFGFGFGAPMMMVPYKPGFGAPLVDNLMSQPRSGTGALSASSSTPFGMPSSTPPAKNIESASMHSGTNTNTNPTGDVRNIYGFGITGPFSYGASAKSADVARNMFGASFGGPSSFGTNSHNPNNRNTPFAFNGQNSNSTLNDNPTFKTRDIPAISVAKNAEVGGSSSPVKPSGNTGVEVQQPQVTNPLKKSLAAQSNINPHSLTENARREIPTSFAGIPTGPRQTPALQHPSGNSQASMLPNSPSLQNVFSDTRSNIFKFGSPSLPAGVLTGESGADGLDLNGKRKATHSGDSAEQTNNKKIKAEDVGDGDCLSSTSSVEIKTTNPATADPVSTNLSRASAQLTPTVPRGSSGFNSFESFVQSARQAALASTLHNKSLRCHYYASGTCKNGNTCRFSHDG